MNEEGASVNDNLSDSTDSSEGSYNPASSPPKRQQTTRRTVNRQLESVTRRLVPGPQSKPLVPEAQRTNLLQKLHLRQMFGKIQRTPNSEEMKISALAAIGPRVMVKYSWSPRGIYPISRSSIKYLM